MLFTMRLAEEPFKKIKSGAKKIELRLYDKKRQQIKIDDTIKFISLKDHCDTVLTRVTDIYRAVSFKDLYSMISLNDLGYSSDEMNLAKSNDMDKFYTLEEQSEYGVVGFRIKIIKENNEDENRRL